MGGAGATKPARTQWTSPLCPNYAAWQAHLDSFGLGTDHCRREPGSRTRRRACRRRRDGSPARPASSRRRGSTAAEDADPRRQACRAAAGSARPDRGRSGRKPGQIPAAARRAARPFSGTGRAPPRASADCRRAQLPDHLAHDLGLGIHHPLTAPEAVALEQPCRFRLGQMEMLDCRGSSGRSAVTVSVFPGWHVNR